MKVQEISVPIVTKGPIKRKRKRPKQSHTGTILIAVFVISAVIAYCIGYEPPKKAVSAPRTYEVQQDDTLWGIAAKVGNDSMDIRETYYTIMKDNGIAHNELIQPGQVLRIRTF